MSLNTSNVVNKRLPLTGSLSAALCGLLLAASSAHAASDTWVSTTGGNWSNTANWLSGTAYADGIDTVADFSLAPANTVAQAINLDLNITVGTLKFSSLANTFASSNSSVITLALTSPTGSPVIDGTATISATIAGTQGFTFTPGGSRTLTLSGANTYTGVTNVFGGNLTIRSNNALGAGGTGNGTVVRQDSGRFPQLHLANNITNSEEITLSYNTGGQAAGTVQGSNMMYNDSGTNTLNGLLTINRSVAAATATNADVIYFTGVQVTAGTLNLAGGVTGSASGGQAGSNYADQTRLQLRNTTAASVTNVSGVISNGTLTSGLSVYTATDSLGIVRLSGANTYTGSTVHQRGSLMINNTTGSGTGAGSVTVLSGATLGGTGRIAPSGTTTVAGVTTPNSIVIQSGAIVAPGDITDAGVAIAAGAALTFDLTNTAGSATFNSGSTIALNFNVNAPTVAESLAFAGLSASLSRVHFNNNVVNFSITGGTLANGLYTIASFDAANAYDGTWVIGTGLSAYNASLIYNANNIQLSISAIPEPSTVALIIGGIALGTVVITRRRRRA